MDNWDSQISLFIQLCNKCEVQLIMVGGGAVNFYGYQRHSADIDFWINTNAENLKKLGVVLQKMGYEISDFPNEVKQQEQNISLKFSPEILNIELITKFNVNKSFEEAYKNAQESTLKNQPEITWKVIAYDDLITSKIKSNRPKDLLDIQELERIKKAQ